MGENVGVVSIAMRKGALDPFTTELTPHSSGKIEKDGVGGDKKNITSLSCKLRFRLKYLWYVCRKSFSGGLFMNVNVAILERRGARVYDQDVQIRKGTSKGIWKIGQ